MVKGALAVRERFERLVADSERLGPEAFQQAYERFLTRVPGPPLMAETRNRFGGAYALTVFTPILAGPRGRGAGGDRGAAGRRREPARPARRAALLAPADLSRARAPGPHAAQARPPAVEPARVHEHVRRRAGPVPGRRLRAPGGRGGRLVGALRRLSGHRRSAPRSSATSATTRSTAACSHRRTPTRACAEVRESLELREQIVEFAAAAQGLGAASCRPASGTGSRADAARAAAEPPAPAVVARHASTSPTSRATCCAATRIRSRRTCSCGSSIPIGRAR